MNHVETADCLPGLLRRLRRERGISQLQLADTVLVRASVVQRAERGDNAKLATWAKLFYGLGYLLLFDVTECSEEAEDLLREEADARRERRWEGLCARRRRFR